MKHQTVTLCLPSQHGRNKSQTRSSTHYPPSQCSGSLRPRSCQDSCSQDPLLPNMLPIFTLSLCFVNPYLLPGKTTADLRKINDTNTVAPNGRTVQALAMFKTLSKPFGSHQPAALYAHITRWQYCFSVSVNPFSLWLISPEGGRRFLCQIIPRDHLQSAAHNLNSSQRYFAAANVR